MSLNIKNERVCALAREAAERHGMSQTSVIELALQRLLDSQADARARKRAELDAFLDEMQAIAARTEPGITTDDLYDERGLPA